MIQKIKDFFRRLPYFIYYVLKSPFMDIYHLIKSVRFDKKQVLKVSKPKFVFNLILGINIANIFFGFAREKARMLLYILIGAYLWKLWVGGEDIHEKREKVKERLIKTT